MSSLNPSIIQVGSFKCETDVSLNPFLSVSGAEHTYARDCTESTDPSTYNCSTDSFEGNVSSETILKCDPFLQTIHRCYCHGDGCNRSFDTAAPAAAPPQHNPPSHLALLAVLVVGVVNM